MLLVFEGAVLPPAFSREMEPESPFRFFNWDPTDFSLRGFETMLQFLGEQVDFIDCPPNAGHFSRVCATLAEKSGIEFRAPRSYRHNREHPGGDFQNFTSKPDGTRVLWLDGEGIRFTTVQNGQVV